MGKKDTPQAPTPPDPYATAAAQGQTNISTAAANSIIGNADTYSPNGSSTYTRTGSQSVQIPDGHGGFTSMDVPQFRNDVTFSPGQQHQFEQQQQLGSGLNNLAINQTQRIGNLLSSPISADGLPGRVNSLDLARQGSTDYSQDRSKVEDAIYSRLNPQLERDRASLENNLVNQGFQRGTEGFNREMDQFGRQSNDARMQAVLAGGGEQSRLAGLDQSRLGFNNAQQQSEADFQNTSRNAGLQENLALRNQPINEISTLMNGGQVSLPQFAQYRGGQVGNTDLQGGVYNSAALNQQNYQTQLQQQTAQQNALIGGLAGLGGAGLYGLGAGGLRRA